MMPAPHTLMLLRHAKAEPWGPDVEDFSRTLTERGRGDMRRLASWMARRLAPPRAVWCSSSQRTRETLMPLLEVWPGLEDHTRYGRELYHASMDSLHRLAAQALEAADSLLLVGHNPGLEDLALRFMGDAERRKHYRMPTGTLAVFEFPRGIGQGAPELRLWIRGKTLAET